MSWNIVTGNLTCARDAKEEDVVVDEVFETVIDLSSKAKEMYSVLNQALKSMCLM